MNSMSKLSTFKKVALATIVFALVIGAWIVYCEIKFRNATGPWTIYVKRENRSSPGHDSHVACIKKLGAQYRVDEQGNLQIKKSQSSRIDNACS
jgi:hypothetical protein